MEKHQLKVYEVSAYKGNNLVKLATTIKEGNKAAEGKMITDKRQNR